MGSARRSFLQGWNGVQKTPPNWSESIANVPSKQARKSGFWESVFLAFFTAMDMATLVAFPSTDYLFWVTWSTLAITKLAACHMCMASLVRSPMLLMLLVHNAMALAYFGTIYAIFGSASRNFYSVESLQSVALHGQAILLATFFLARFFNSAQGAEPQFQPKILPSTTKHAFAAGSLIFAYAATAVSFYLGISRMGSENIVVLPFQLGGILTVVRIAVLPFLGIAILAWNLKPRYFWIVMFVIWLLCEAYIRGSRSALPLGLTPMAIYVIYRFGLSRKLLVWIGFGLALSVVLYPLITALRFFGELDLGTAEAAELNADFFSVYRRAFLTGHIVSRFLDMVPYLTWSGDAWSNVVRAYGSPAGYVTYFLDNTRIGVVHSSGSTMYAEGLMLFGLAGLHVANTCAVFFAMIFERNRFSAFSKVAIFLILLNFLMQGALDFMLAQRQYFFTYVSLAALALAIGSGSATPKRRHLPQSINRTS
jgi:hypothetical protein